MRFFSSSLGSADLELSGSFSHVTSTFCVFSTTAFVTYLIFFVPISDINLLFMSSALFFAFFFASFLISGNNSLGFLFSPSLEYPSTVILISGSEEVNCCSKKDLILFNISLYSDTLNVFSLAPHSVLLEGHT